MSDSHLGFGISRSEIVQGILIPKFYDPELTEALELAREAGFHLPELGEVLLPGEEGSRLGVWIPREFYGTGDIPYVRTSDLSHWRIRSDYKKGVAEHIYERWRNRQDIQLHDLLLVAHGTYLVGTAAIVTREETRLVLQDHIYRLRPNAASGIDPWFLVAALSTAFVLRQVRSRQFSAEIIDKIGDRHLGLRVPIPRDSGTRVLVTERVQAIISEQSLLRAEMREVSRSDLRMTRERAEARYGFRVKRQEITDRILVPKYYDPKLEADLAELEREDGYPWVSIGELVDSGLISVETGVEVGKMAYGTGAIPFIRTTDLADWEIKRGVKQGISPEIYVTYEKKASVQSPDILLVRDGTYLVGSSAMVMEDDGPALFAGGLYRLRVLERKSLDAYTLLGFLNLPIVRRQMRARQFTRDVIDTLGHRLLEVRIPFPQSDEAKATGRVVAEIMKRKAVLKREIGAIVDLLEPPSLPTSAGRPGWSMR